MARRYEFSKPTKREALKRSAGLCEAIGEVYGLMPGRRCNAPLSKGVEFDHYPAPAVDPGSDTLANCVACCPTCHRHKTGAYDVPMQAKGKRVSDKHRGIKPSRGNGFRKAPPQRSASRPIIRRNEQP
jgi:5-methylcytosine-specific restriction endonuclease McrA